MYKKLIALFLFTIFTSVLTGCFDKKDDTIKIGFVAGLSGKYSALGTSIRDGFILAFDEIDNKINGKEVVIIQKDDKQDEKEAKKIIEQFVKDDIKLIVGNATSSMTAVSLPIINKQKGSLLISATASSNTFSGKDDNFLRVQVEQSIKRYKDFGNYIKKQHFNNIFIIYDSKNYSYAKGYIDFILDLSKKNKNIKIVAKEDLNSEHDDIIKKIKSSKTDLILIVGNSVDTANIIQHIRFNHIDTKIFASGWAKTMDFIKNGGKAVEGTLFYTGYNEQSKDECYIEFVEKFKNKYHHLPSEPAAQGYELAKILIQNLQVSSDISTLKKRILKTKTYKGLQGRIIFDKYGDISKQYFMMRIKDAKFIKIDTKR